MINDTLDNFVERQTGTLCELWNQSCEEINHLPLVVTQSEKIENETRLSSLLEWLGSKLDQTAMSETERKEFSEEALLRAKQAGKEIFNLNDEQVNCIEKLGIDRSAQEFYQKAKDFNPFVSFADIFQASRNVWTCNYLQTLLNLPARLTPSIFAYSMLYPVSDNFLDDPSCSGEDKALFNRRFRAWLEGEEIAPRCWNEEDVHDLVKIIEGQYPRKQYPQIYDGLLAIHNAQIRSIKTQDALRRSECSEISEVTFEKGGTSVLADGFLAAGELSQEEMEIIFNYGAFAQLMDDQEDVESDLKAGTLTLFTLGAKDGKTDQVMNRVFSFAHQVLKGLQMFNSPQALPLKQVSLKGIDLLLIDGVLRTEKVYSPAYLHELERHFPFRFEYLKRVRKEIRKKNITTERICGLLMPSQTAKKTTEPERLPIELHIRPAQESCALVQDHSSANLL
jgi:hypothetical protein